MVTAGEWIAMRFGEVIAKYRSPITGVNFTQSVAHAFGEDER